MCGHRGIEFLIRKEPYLVWRCKDCGHGWVDPPPSQEEIGAYYASKISLEEHHFPEKNTIKHAKRVYRWIGQVLTPPGKLLDIGCGRGIQMKVAKQAGWHPVGIEWTEALRKGLLSQQWEVFPSCQELPVDYGSSFDVVTALEVLEHQADPGSFLEQIRSFMKEKGVLALSTPNFGSIVSRQDPARWHEIVPPSHLHFFTPESLRCLMNKKGFYIIDQLTYGVFSPALDRFVESVNRLFNFSPEKLFVLKTGLYRAAKFYFDRTLQIKKQGLGLLTLAGLFPERTHSNLRKYFC